MTESIAAEERQREEFARPKESVWLWYGMLVGPAMGMLMIWINYPLVDRACVGGNRIWLHVASAVLLLIVLSGWVVSWRHYERVGDFPLTEGGVMPRSRFMSLVGLFTASLGILEIVTQWAPIFFLRACIGT